MTLRERETILKKIEQFETWLSNGIHTDMEEFTRGSLSALYWVLKMKNPYTGADLGVEGR